MKTRSAPFRAEAISSLLSSAAREALGQLFADLDFHLGVGLSQRLPVGVDGDELHAAKARVNHAVDRVVSAAAAADNLDGSKGVLFFVLEFDHVLNLPTDYGKSP